ncbi:recombination protein RecR [Candidatus Saccharibacteria bacterium]|nr:recombination protein RecR [Candidatus Saccharibacteria bacterium]
MKVLPTALQQAIEAFRALPGIGPRSAERYAYFLLKNNPNIAKKISGSISDLHDNIDYCPKTYALIEKGQKYSELYTNSKRDKTVVAVVAEPFDVLAIENTGNFNGTYHVLGGLISPIDGVGPDELTITQLFKRVFDDNVKEIILATNASVEGESTALYIQKQFDNSDVLITRLARGLPIGIDLEYADQITLTRALEGRQSI